MAVDGFRSRAACALAGAWLLAADAKADARAPDINAAAGDAAQRSVGFVWEGPAGVHDCITPEALRAAVESDVGQKVFRDGPSDVTLHVRVERLPASGFRATLVIEAADGRTWGQRELSTEEPSCSSLDQPLVLAATLLVDKDMLEPPPKEEPRPEPPPPPEPPRLVIVNPAPVPDSDPHKSQWTFSADGALLGGTGLAPRFSVGGGLGVEAAPYGWPTLRLHAAAFLPSGQEAAGASLRSSSAHLGLAICPNFVRVPRVAVGLCLGADVVRMSIESSGVRAPRKTSKVFGQGSLGGRVTFMISRPWFLRLAATLMPPFARDEYVVSQADGSEVLVFQRSPFSWAAGFGVGAEFGGPE